MGDRREGWCGRRVEVNVFTASPPPPPLFDEAHLTQPGTILKCNVLGIKHLHTLSSLSIVAEPCLVPLARNTQSDLLSCSSTRQCSPFLSLSDSLPSILKLHKHTQGRGGYCCRPVQHRCRMQLHTSAHLKDLCLKISTKIIEQLGPQELLKTQVHSSSRHGR